MSFLVLDHTFGIVRQLRPLVSSIRRHDSKLAAQLRDAGSSVALNLGEGNRRQGRDRGHLWRIASGSAEEVRTALKVAEAWGYIDQAEAAAVLADVDRLQAMLWKLTR